MGDKNARRWRLGVALAASSVVVLSACQDGTSEQSAATAAEDGAASSSDTTPVTAPAEWEHVHNLTLDGNRLLVGTHEGLWAQPGGEAAQLVSDPPFDVMGLALSGQAMFASGHPAEGQDLPADLGLQRSTDGGVTWTGVSLEGEVDFHRLRVSGRALLGVSAHDGTLLRSTDEGDSWTDLGVQPLYDLAVSPQNAEQVVGTTERGPVASDDGGTSFAPLTGAPLLALLSWSSNQLYGVSPDGVVHLSRNDGASWSQVGRVAGQPSAIAAQGKTVVVLAGETVFESRDGGATFAPRITGVGGGH